MTEEEYREIHKKIYKLIEMIKDNLSPEDYRDIDDYVDKYGEPGVAFDMMCDKLDGADKPISAETYQLIEEVGHQYEDEYDRTYLERLVE